MLLYRIKTMYAVERCGNYTESVGFIAAESEEDVCEKLAAHVGEDLDKTIDRYDPETDEEVEVTFRQIWLESSGSMGYETFSNDPEDVVVLEGWELIGEVTPAELAVLDKFGALLNPRSSTN